MRNVVLFIYKVSLKWGSVEWSEVLWCWDVCVKVGWHGGVIQEGCSASQNPGSSGEAAGERGRLP